MLDFYSLPLLDMLVEMHLLSREQVWLLVSLISSRGLVEHPEHLESLKPLEPVLRHAHLLVHFTLDVRRGNQLRDKAQIARMGRPLPIDRSVVGQHLLLCERLVRSVDPKAKLRPGLLKLLPPKPDVSILLDRLLHLLLLPLNTDNDVLRGHKCHHLVLTVKQPV